MFIDTLDPQTAETRMNEFKMRWPTAAAASNGRAERAAHMASSRALVETTDDPAIFFVHSESNADAIYTVNTALKSCTCPDHGKAGPKGAVCKHRLTVAYLTAFGAQPPKPSPQQSETDILWEQSLALREQIRPLSDARWVIGEALAVLAETYDDWRATPERREETKAKARALYAQSEELSKQISHLAQQEQAISDRYYTLKGCRH